MIKAEQDLRQKLLDFATSARYDDELERAFITYWDNKYDIASDNQLDELDQARFLEFYLFDYRTAEYDLTFVELFDEFRGYTLNDIERKIVSEWRSTVFGVFIRGETEDQGTKLIDMFDESEFVVVNPELAEMPEQCLLVGRIISVLGKHRFSGPVATLSETVTDSLHELVTARFEEYRKEMPGTTWRDFFRTERHGLQHMLLDLRIAIENAQNTNHTDN